MDRTVSFDKIKMNGKFAATSLADMRAAGRKTGKVLDGINGGTVMGSLQSKMIMRTVFKSMEIGKRRKLDLSNKQTRLEAARSLKDTARALSIAGDLDESVWPLLMGAKALEGER